MFWLFSVKSCPELSFPSSSSIARPAKRRPRSMHLRRRRNQLRLLIWPLDAQQLFRLGTEAGQVGILGHVLLHPLTCLVVRPAGLVSVPELPVGHGQEKQLIGVTTVLLQLHRLLQCFDTCFELSG